jgi:hypothetical protein
MSTPAALMLLLALRVMLLPLSVELTAVVNSTLSGNNITLNANNNINAAGVDIQADNSISGTAKDINIQNQHEENSFVCVITPLSAIFQLYRGDQFSWWKKLEYPERTTDHRQAILFAIMRSCYGIGTYDGMV